MKKLMYLFVAGTMFAFTACNCGTGDATEEAASDMEGAVVEEVVEEVVEDTTAAEEVEAPEEETTK